MKVKCIKTIIGYEKFYKIGEIYNANQYNSLFPYLYEINDYIFSTNQLCSIIDTYLYEYFIDITKYRNNLINKICC